MELDYSFITKDMQSALQKYHRLVNYLGAAELYLKDNFLLERPLDIEDIKKRVLGHWGTVPGLNFIYINLNLLIQRHESNVMLIVGPGHGYPALLANLFVEGSLGKFYPQYVFNKNSWGDLIKNFSWPGGFPSHANPETPATILEGGELGYSLSTAFGAVFDNPNLIAACVVGDGEAETGPLAAAWHSTKYLNPVTDGAVLPIVHINGYKISGSTIYGTMSNDELLDLFGGYGYEPIIVEQDKNIYANMAKEMEYAYQRIRKIQSDARDKGIVKKPKWPVILFRNKKGWTGPIQGKDNEMIEDSFRSHGIPLEHVYGSDAEFQILKEWLESYNVRELLDDTSGDIQPIQEILDLIPSEDLRMGMNIHANNFLHRPLKLPDATDYQVYIPGKQSIHESNNSVSGFIEESNTTKQLENIDSEDFAEIDPEKLKEISEHLQITESTIPEQPDVVTESSTNIFGKYLRDVVAQNPSTFRVMSPDESHSNKLSALFDVTKRTYIWPVPPGAEDIDPFGRVMEILSEHTLQGWMQGYVMTGRNSIFISYEAFVMIIASMVDQYSKFLKQAKNIDWRKPLPSMNYVLTSNSWRQDHNGYSHQNPGFISSVLNDYSEFVHVYFPPDANSMLLVAEKIFSETNTINVVVAGKRKLPQYLTIKEAKQQIETGIMRWERYGNQDDEPDVVFAASGDYSVNEVICAIRVLKKYAPYLKTRFVCVSELTCLSLGSTSNKAKSDAFAENFTYDRQIIYAYHGYAEDIKSLVFDHPESRRFNIFGYKEKGTTTTPFDMQVLNECSRFHLALKAVKFAAEVNPKVEKNMPELIEKIYSIITKHEKFIVEFGEDIEEVVAFDKYFPM